jgi:hypothetical protein
LIQGVKCIAFYDNGIVRLRLYKEGENEKTWWYCKCPLWLWSCVQKRHRILQVSSQVSNCESTEAKTMSWKAVSTAQENKTYLLGGTKKS